MGSLPVIKPPQVVALLEVVGFAEVRRRSSHKRFRHPDGRTTTVPFHAGRDISPALNPRVFGSLGLCVLVLAALTLVATGCGVSAEPPEPQWEKVTSGRISGDKTSSQYVGTFYLVSEARLAWGLSGPSDARAEFELMAVRSSEAGTTEGSGTSLRS